MHSFGAAPPGIELLGMRQSKVSIDFALAAWNTIASHEVFTVTGLVRALMIYNVTADLTSGGAATISFGDETNTIRFAGLQAYTNLTAGYFVLPGGTVTLGCRVEADYRQTYNADMFLKGLDIGFAVAVAALTGGTMDAYCFWSPITDGATVVAAAGGPL